MGIVFDGFNQAGETFAFPFGVGETEHNTTSINHIIRTNRIPKDILDYPDIATHFRTTELARYLDTRTHEIENLTVIRDTATLESLAGTYDLLIDSTGFGRHVSKQDDNFYDISHIIPNNRALTTRIPYTDVAKQCKPYSMFKAMEYGWCWHIPLGDQLAFGYVHNSNYDVTDEFKTHIIDYMGVSPDKIDTVNFITGRNHVHLKDNVVSIGLASTFIEPLESTGIYLIIASIEKIANYIDGNITQDEYNKSINKTFDGIVNFIVAHYKYSARSNQYWDHYKTLDVVLRQETELFPPQAWDYVLSGFDIGVAAPVEKVNPDDFAKIYKGQAYHKWIHNESNFK